MGRIYHNITAKYNGYFNANVLYEEAIITLNKQHVDNYTKILDLYPYMAVENPKAVGPDMDKAVSKVSTVASVHPLSDWVDDCFLLAGKAQHIKQDFESAEETLEYMAKEYSPEAIKEKLKGRDKTKVREKELKEKKKAKEKEAKEKAKEKAEVKKEKEKTKEEIKKQKEKEKKQKEKERKAKNKARAKAKKDKTPVKTITDAPVVNMETKKDPSTTTKTESVKEEKEEKKEDPKDQKPPKKFLKRQPAYQMGLVWLCRTYIERQKYDDALSIINKLTSEPGIYPNVLEELAPVHAYYYLKQKRYDAAIAPLENAIKLANKKEDRARYSYILAQIYQKSGNQSEALAYFQKVLKYSSKYEMDFNAKLNIALNSYRSGQSTIDLARRDLQKMLKDSKNTEYKDQIYFTLAQLDIEAKDNNAAIADLKASLLSNTQNKVQKTESYLLLAELYYKNTNYVNSKAYYDSTLLVMAPADDRFISTKRFSISLIDIAKNQEIITLQDSLLKIAAMSEKDQREVARLIKEQREADAKKNQLAASAKNDQTNPANPNNNRSIAGSNFQIGNSRSTFFAYDQKALKKGQMEFEKIWGARELTDNWRRSNNQISTSATDPDQVVVQVEEPLDKEYQEILRDVPKTPQQIEEANNKIQVATVALGRLYQDQLKDYDLSIKLLDNYLVRYPESKYELEVWYYLYLAHNSKGDLASAQVYYDKIVGKYPNTNYARVLSDPNYLTQARAAKLKLENYYDTTYALFQAGQYQRAQDSIRLAQKYFGYENKYKAKFALLDAMCLGYTQGKSAYIGALKDIIAKFPDSEEEKRAKEIIRLLGVEGAKPLDKGDKPAEVQAYSFTPDDAHFVIYVTGNVPEKLNVIKTSVAGYNQEFYSFDKLKVTNIFLNTETPLLIVRQFDDSEKAEKYVENAYKNKDSFYKDLKDGQLITISKDNYKSLLLNKDIKIYEDFYRGNYK